MLFKEQTVVVSWTHPEKAVSRLNSDALVTQLPSSSQKRCIRKMNKSVLRQADIRNPLRCVALHQITAGG